MGALLWCVDIGIAAYEIKGIYDAIKNESILDTNGIRQPYSNSLYKFTIPLTIGTEVASFIQERLYVRSDYLLHKAALAFNESVARKASPGSLFDLRIDKSGFGSYRQGGLTFGDPVLDGILLGAAGISGARRLVVGAQGNRHPGRLLGRDVCRTCPVFVP